MAWPAIKRWKTDVVKIERVKTAHPQKAYVNHWMIRVLARLVCGWSTVLLEIALLGELATAEFATKYH